MQIERKQIAHLGQTWDYYVTGRGSTALLAFAGSLGASETLLKVLAEAAPDHKIIAPAYPVVDSIRQMFEGVERILSAESARPDTVYGGSFGGILAQEWIRRFPREIRCAFLSGCGVPDPARAVKNRRWLGRLPFTPLFLMRAGLRLVLNKMMKEVTRDADAWRRDYVELIRALRKSDLEMRYRIAIDFDENCKYTSSDLDAWPGRMLIFEGGMDKVAKPETREGLRRMYPRARVHSIPLAGHALLLTHTDECVRTMQSVMQEP